MSKAAEIKEQIHVLIEKYFEEVFKAQEFVPGKSTIPVSGKVFDHLELQHITDAALDGWFTTGRFNTTFEKELAKYDLTTLPL